MLAALLLLAAPLQGAAPAVEGRLGDVEVVTGPIFSAGEERETLFRRLVNATHWTTRESVVRREIWKRRGDPVDEAFAAELERNLRALGLFAEADVTLVPPPSPPPPSSGLQHRGPPPKPRAMPRGKVLCEVLVRETEAAGALAESGPPPWVWTFCHLGGLPLGVQLARLPRAPDTPVPPKGAACKLNWPASGRALFMSVH